MRKLIVAAFVSLDGVMQAPGGPTEDPTGGFKFGGWLPPHFDDAVGQAVGGLFERPFDLVLGRKTYEIFAAHWPFVAPDDPIGPVFDRATKFVATRDPNFKLEWQNSRWLGVDPVAEIKRLKGEEGPDLLTQGSANFLQTLFAADLVDELQTLTFPVVLGKGKRLFQGEAAPRTFSLTSSTATGTGVVVSRYARAGAVEIGSFQMAEPTPREQERQRKLVEEA
ncbi:dihydrofolate reductase family protein [Caulobacter sp. 1776]|uniref:dihydrofolate reductase family protein n=1 Tax=Caulobacter sp. 1776 TaxID=3156420 RepID=UPI00339AD619